MHFCCILSPVVCGSDSTIDWHTFGGKSTIAHGWFYDGRGFVAIAQGVRSVGNRSWNWGSFLSIQWKIPVCVGHTSVPIHHLAMTP